MDGERHLFARSNRGTGTILDVADRDGHSLGASELAWDDDDLEVVFDGERATLARDEESGVLAILELDRQGAVALSTRVPFPTTRRLYARVGTLEATGGPLAAIATMSPRVAEYSLSWFRFDRGATALRSVAEVALPPTYVQHIGLLRRGADEILGVLRIGDRELSQLLIIRLTEGGEELDRWTLGEGAGALETTEVHSHLGSVFVSYVRQLDRGVNQVEVLELGCVE